MPDPAWTDVATPKGATRRNWPLMLGIAFSLLAGIGLVMTNQEPIVAPVYDPLAVRPDTTVEAPLSDSQVATVAEGIRADATARARETAAARRRAEDEDRRRQAEEARANAEREARYREALSALQTLRAQPDQTVVDRGFSDVASQTSDETAMLQALRLQELQRQHDALSAPMVTSSARGIGAAQHALERPEITAAVSAQRSPDIVAQAVGGEPAFAVPGGAGAAAPLLEGLDRFAGDSSFADGVSAAEVGAGFGPAGPAAPVRGPGAPAGTVVDTAGPAVLPADAVSSGDFTLGPRSDAGGRDDPAGVVVTPNDGPHSRLYEGTLVPAVLQTQIDGQFSGPVRAQVIRHVYSGDRQRVLIPTGTVVLGTAGTVTGPFQDRLAVAFHRMIFPDGRWLTLDFAGLNRLGETSLKDQVNRHYVSTFGAAGAVGLLAGLSSAGSGAGQFRSGTSEQMAMIAVQQITQLLNRPAEVTIRAGHPLNVYLTSDVVFPVYAAWNIR